MDDFLIEKKYEIKALIWECVFYVLSIQTNLTQRVLGRNTGTCSIFKV